MTTVALDIDDASIIRTKYHLLKQLIERYPKIKISLFFIPYDVESEMVQLIKIYRKDRLIELKELIASGHVELIPHGLMHRDREFEHADKFTMRKCLEAIEEVFGMDGLPYVKGFKAPFWLYNQDVVDVLDKNGWWMGVNRDDPRALKTKRYYKYNHSIHEPFWESGDSLWKLHGHMDGSDNDLEKNFLNLYKIPLGDDVEFKFASQLVEEDE